MKGSHVFLRAMEPEDLDLLYRIENDEELWCVGSTNVPYSRYLLHDFIAESKGDIYADRQVRLVVENECHEVVGMADIVNFEPKHLRAEVGIVILQSQRRHGYASSALQCLHDYVGATLHLHQLYAVVAADNEASLSLFRHAGYQASMQLKEWLYDGTSYVDGVVMQKILSAG